MRKSVEWRLPYSRAAHTGGVPASIRLCRGGAAEENRVGIRVKYPVPHGCAAAADGDKHPACVRGLYPVGLSITAQNTDRTHRRRMRRFLSRAGKGAVFRPVRRSQMEMRYRHYNQQKLSDEQQRGQGVMVLVQFHGGCNSQYKTQYLARKVACGIFPRNFLHCFIPPILDRTHEDDRLP